MIRSFETRSVLLLLGTGLLVAGCVARGGPAETALGAEDPTPGDQDRLVTVSLEHVDVIQIVRVMAEAMGLPVVIEPQADPVARCARITVMTPEPVHPQDLFELVGRAVEGAGLRLERTAQGLIVGRGPSDATHVVCEEGAVDAQATVVAPEEDPTPSIVAAIRELSPLERVISRDAANRFFESSVLLTRSFRIVPFEQGGQVVGMRLFGIRSGSVVEALGFRNGDVVTKLGEFNLVSPDAALEAYAHARGSDEVTFEILRQGLTLRLHIRAVDTLPPP
jgi:hypothetical protein